MKSVKVGAYSQDHGQRRSRNPTTAMGSGLASRAQFRWPTSPAGPLRLPQRFLVARGIWGRYAGFTAMLPTMPVQQIGRIRVPNST